MSDCPRASELLTADVETLRGLTDSDLARHIATCPDCQTTAARVLAATVALSEALDDIPAPDAALLMRRDVGPRTGWWRFPHAPLRWVLPVAGTAASAAALYLALAVPGPALEGEPWSPPSRMIPPLVDAPGHDVVVFPTTDPDITIIWLVKGETE